MAALTCHVYHLQCWKRLFFKVNMIRLPCRYYSAYHYYRWWLQEDKPPTPDNFHETALKEIQQWKDCVAASSVSDCVRRFKPQQLVKGMYAEFLPVSTLQDTSSSSGYQDGLHTYVLTTDRIACAINLGPPV